MNHSISFSKFTERIMNSSTTKEYPLHLVDEMQETASCISSTISENEPMRTGDWDDNSATIEALHVDQSIFRSIEQKQDITPSEDHSIPKSCIVSFSGDECEVSSLGDPTVCDTSMPLDYRHDWSIDNQSSLQVILQANESNARPIQDVSYDLMKCDSIVSIDMESDCEDADLDSGPIADWIDSEDIMW